MHETFPWGGFGATPLTAPRPGTVERRQKTCRRRVSLFRGHFRGHHQGRHQPVLLERPAGRGNGAGIRCLRVLAGCRRRDCGCRHAGAEPSLALVAGRAGGRKAGSGLVPVTRRAAAGRSRRGRGLRSRPARGRKLTPQARQSWRWRQLYLRALLDAELKANGGKPNARCNEAFAELIKIYHAENANPAVRPPLPR